MSDLRLSDDGLYYWDGRQWVSTLSPDGRWRWTGSAWVPLAAVAVPRYPMHQPLTTVRTATPWTAPMQAAVAGVFVLYGLYSLTTPFWMSGVMAQAFNQSFQRQQQLNPAVSPPPPEVINSLSTLMSEMLWVSVFVTVAICAVAVVGALKRWTWAFWAILVIFGIVSLFLPFNLAGAVTGFSSVSTYGPPAWTTWLTVAFELAGAALFVWMLIAIIRYGPWAMTRSAEPPMPAVQAPAS